MNVVLRIFVDSRFARRYPLNRRVLCVPIETGMQCDAVVERVCRMSDAAVDRYWFDISAIIGDRQDPALCFRQAVHLSVYWGQAMSDGPVCAPVHPPKRLAERMRQGLPLSEDECRSLSAGKWPPPDEAFDLSTVPRVIDNVQTKDGGSVSWLIDDASMYLRKTTPIPQCMYVGEISIRYNVTTSIRQRAMHIGTRGPIPGVPKSLKLLSSICGLYDGGVRMWPEPTLVDTDADAKSLIALIESEERRQPVIAVACSMVDSVAEWRSVVEKFARDAFTLMHVAAVTARGAHHLQDLLGPHGIEDGAIKTFKPGFTRLDVPQFHPMTLHRNVLAHEQGREGMLTRWRNRVMTGEAWDRRDEPLNSGR